METTGPDLQENPPHPHPSLELFCTHVANGHIHVAKAEPLFGYKQCHHGRASPSTSRRAAPAPRLQPQVLLDPLERWEALAKPQRSGSHRLLPAAPQADAPCPCASRCCRHGTVRWSPATPQILTWASPGAQALFGPNQPDFSQPPPQSAAGTLLPPYPAGETCLSHSTRVASQTGLLTTCPATTGHFSPSSTYRC